MADELKRVGLVFTQEGAVDFKKTLQEINLEMTKNYNQFKLTQAQWDKSTTSTQKLRAEQEYLKNAYEIQQDKVNTLRMQLSDLENAENKNTTAIKKKRNELTAAEVKLESYNQKIKDIEMQLGNTGKKIEEFGSKVKDSGNKIEGAGKKLSAFSIATGTALLTAAKGAIDFESAFTGVEKTVDGTEEQMNALKQGIRDMSKEIPASTTEISAVAEAAGQLGIQTDNILEFTKTMINMGNATNLSADEAATTLARFANVTKMSQSDFNRLGSVIVALGNNFATTEAEITNMGMNLASAGTQVGMSQSQIMALATALSSVGLEAQAGGTAFSKVMINMQLAVEKGGDSLKDFASVAGMSSKVFKKAFKQDATNAIMKFVEGLSKSGKQGKSAIKILDDMGITETRLRDALLRSANASDVMSKAIKLGNEAWEDNTALTNEANKRYETLQSKISIAINKLKDIGVTIGNKLMPYISKLIDGVEGLANWFSNLSDEQVEFIMNIGLAVTAIGPLLMILGKVTSTVGGAIEGIGAFTQAIGVVRGTVTSTSTAVNGLANVFSAITSPIGLTTIALGALIAAYTAHHVATTQQKASLNGLRQEVDNQKQSWEELAKTRQESLSSSMTEIEISEKLAEDLKQITDENGKVKEGYETRAKVILNQLNNALGTEYKLNGNIISQYQELKDNIDKIIAVKKAEAILNAYQEEYGTAIKEQAKATETLIGLKKQLVEATNTMATGNAKERMEAEILYSSIAQKIGEQTELVSSYGKTIQDYESLQKASVEGSAEAIEKAVTEIGISYETAKEKTKESLEEQIVNQSEYVKFIKESLAQAKADNDQYQAQILNNQLTTNQQQLNNLINSLTEQTLTVKELTPKQIEAWKYAGQQSYSKYSEGISKLPPETRKKIQEATGIIAVDTGLSTTLGQKGSQATSLFKDNLKLPEKMQEKIKASSDTLKMDTKIQNEAGNLANRAKQAIARNNSNAWGRDMVDGLGRGIQSRGNSNWFTNILSGLAGKIASFLHFSKPDTGPLREYEKWMPDMVEGLGKSLDKSSPRLIKSVKNMTEEMSSDLQKIDDFKQINNKDNKSSNAQTEISNLDFDYNKMANAIEKALTNCKFTLDEDGFAKIVKDELYKVV